MEEIIIQYDTYYDKWLEAIQKGLKEHDILYDNQLVTNICNSLKLTIDSYLTSLRYHPQKYLSYRTNFIKRLASKGFGLSIKSNHLLWKYLEYFTDLTDYSNCFDIEIYIVDYSKAIHDCRFITIETNSKIAAILPHSSSYIQVCKCLNRLILDLENNKELPSYIKDIIYVLEYIIMKGE